MSNQDSELEELKRFIQHECMNDCLNGEEPTMVKMRAKGHCAHFCGDMLKLVEIIENIEHYFNDENKH